MKNTFGQNMAVTIFGESHGPYIGAVLDGLTPGMPIDEEYMKKQLSKRRPQGKISTARREADEYQIVSGAFEGRTTGTPLTILIPNSAQHSKDYAATRALARPGHADYTAYMKYHGFEDYRGGGHFSGRITAALVAAGAVVIPALKSKGIMIGTHIRCCSEAEDREFADLAEDLRTLDDLDFPVLDRDRAAEMLRRMEQIASEGDSVGGILETAVSGVPAGVGEPWFDSVESILSHALFSIPAVKGVEFGAGFDMVRAKGSEFNDPLRMQGGKVVTLTNNNGGINGGITNGMPILFKTAVKPTPSIYKTQETVDFLRGEDALLNIEGRHDPAIIHRARVVVDSVTALVLYDLLIGRYGTDYFA